MTLRRARLLLALAAAPLLAASPTSSQESRDRLLVDASAVGAPISPLRLRAVHRAPRPLHLRRPVGRDARGPQVLLPGRPARRRPGRCSRRARAPATARGIPTSCWSARPWMVLGDRAAVSMVKEGAYVGEHSPRLALPGGEQAARARCRSGSGSSPAASTSGRIVLRADGRRGADRGQPRLGRRRERPADGRDRATRGTSFTKHPLRFRAGGATDNGRLEIVARGTGALAIGAVSLMPADNVLGWRRDTLARLRELDSPVYRWPGGNFVSGYDWQDGIGDPTGGRRARTRPGRASSATTSASTSSWPSCARSAPSRTSPSTPAWAARAAAAELVSTPTAPPTTPHGQAPRRRTAARRRSA